MNKNNRYVHKGHFLLIEVYYHKNCPTGMLGCHKLQVEWLLLLMEMDKTSFNLISSK